MTLRRPAALAVVLALTCGALTSCIAATAQAASTTAKPPAGVPSIDISSWQPHVNWKTVKADHLRFAYIKATEGTHYISPTIQSQYHGARGVGIVVGAYHFATPDTSSGGAAQARYFAAHGGGWKAGTLPGAARDPLWINAHGGTAHQLPTGWTSYTVWQWAETGTYPCDQDVIPASLFKHLHNEPRSPPTRLVG